MKRKKGPEKPIRIRAFSRNRLERIGFGAAIGFAFVLALSAMSCTCDGDAFDDEDIERPCDCSGMALAIFEDCHGVIEIDGEMPSVEEFAGSCNEAIGGETVDKDVFACRIQATCDARDCEDLAKRLQLCAY